MNLARKLLQTSALAAVSAIILAGCEPPCTNTGHPGAWQQDFDFEIGKGRSILPTGDGGYLIVGQGSPHGAPAPDLLKTDSTGEVMWAKFRGGPIQTDAVVEIGDGSFVIVGFTREQENVARLDGDGEVIWSRFLGDNVETPPSLTQAVSTSDGNIAAISSSHYSLPRTASVVKFDLDGSLIWTRVLIVSANYVRGVAPTETGGVTVLTERFLRRIADDGTEAWTVPLSQDFVGDGFIVATDDDGVAILVDDRLTGFNREGNVIWSKTVAPTVGTEPIDFRATPDGGFIVGSSTFSYESSSSYFPRTSWYCQNMVLTKLDGRGDITWDREYGTESISFLDAVAPTSDGGYIILGSRGRSFFSSWSFMFLLKVGGE